MTDAATLGQGDDAEGDEAGDDAEGDEAGDDAAAAARLLIVRHAQSEWNAAGRWQGQADPSLSELGRAQARAAAAAPVLGDTAAVVSSDLARARATAEIIAAAVGAGPVVADAGLRERRVGPWQGLTAQEIERRYPGDLAAGRRPAGWEGDDSLLARVLDALRRAAGLAGPGLVVIVSHAGVLYALERYFGHEFEHIGNLGGRCLFGGPGGFRLGRRVSLIGGGERP